ncbi:MAG: hypothetical protein Q4D96_05465 [Propionibacteriaceae bacterium]|nr:hypothetical protein [Propionibacteriaceae bacterium]
MSTMNAPQPGYYGPSQGRGNNGIVITLVVAIVLAVAGFGGWWFFNNQSTEQAQPLPVEQSQAPQQPAPTQSETQGQQTETQAPSQEQSPSREQAPAQNEKPQPEPRQEQTQPRQNPPQEKKQPTQNEKAPVMPESFGNFKSDSTRLSSSLGSYRDADSRFIMFMHIDGLSAEDMKKYSRKEVREIGGWYCSTIGKGDHPSLDCATSVYGGSLSVTGSADRFTEEELVTIGDEFLAAWK